MHRVLIFSHTYIPPSNRGKLRALAARGLDVTVGVPQRWRDPVLGRTLEIAWERQNGVEVFPLPARHHGDAATLTFGGRALHALLRDKRPDLIQVEEERTAPAARQVVRAARQLKLPAVLFTHHNVVVSLPWLAGWRRNRTLRRLRGAIAGSAAAAALVRELAPGLRVGVIPQLGVYVPTEPEHAYHDGLAIGCVGRLVPEKGIDTLLLALAENRAHRWHLTVVGDGPDRERLERLASDLRLAARVRWAGALPPEDVRKLWPELDVLVLPARALPTWAEPAAHVVAEAMAYEVAVVGTSAVRGTRLPPTACRPQRGVAMHRGIPRTAHRVPAVHDPRPPCPRSAAGALALDGPVRAPAARPAGGRRSRVRGAPRRGDRGP